MVRRISRRGVASSKRSLASREETSRHAAMRPRSAKKGGARYARGEEAEVSDVGAFPRLARDALRVPSLGAPWHLGDLARGLLLPRIDEDESASREDSALELAASDPSAGFLDEAEEALVLGERSVERVGEGVDLLARHDERRLDTQHAHVVRRDLREKT